MKKIIQITLVLIAIQACSTRNSVFQLSPQQSMSITGKGEGQDAAINPFGASKSIATVSNLGSTPFKVRIEQNGEIIENIEVMPDSTEEFVLDVGDQLFLDSDEKGKAKVTFKEG